SVELGHLNPGGIDHLNFTGSTYQLGKFVKHTLPPTHSGLVSIFSDPSYSNYKNYIVNTVASGSTEFDQYHRKNIIWYAARENGVSFLNGIPRNTTDIVKVVLPLCTTRFIATQPTHLTLSPKTVESIELSESTVASS
ncbi:MAG TPA: hypothetical protein VKQ08_00975, partial [Cyclobacteriaceae bacterium]|nr:hypothetical protein [Cyclobacteriaceae bacterium]